MKRIHYLSDSPTSQYRNSTIFSILQCHDQLLNGLSATWQYFESGHGKAPCDGVGAAMKRAADLAVRKEQLIKSATDFMAWASNLGDRSLAFFLHVSSEEVQTAAMELEGVPKVPILKTMKLHAVVAHQGILVSREVSYFDTCCWQDGVFQQTCPGWVTHVHLVPREEPPRNNHGTNTEPQEESSQVPPPAPTPPEEPVQAEDQQLAETELEPDWNVGDFVAAKYNGETFAGKITEVEDCEYNITFMEA